MDPYGYSPSHQGSDGNQSSSWNGGGSVPEGIGSVDGNQLSEGNVALSYLYYPNIQGLLWDPSSLASEGSAGGPALDRRNEKRDEASNLSLIPNKRLYIPDMIYDALQQTTVPSVPQQERTELPPEETPVVTPIVPPLEFFSNDIFYYDGRADSAVEENAHAPQPPAPAFIPIWDPFDRIWARDVDDYSSDSEVVYSDEEDSKRERDPVKCHTLSLFSVCIMRRESYSCPICYESPVSPVSTICGHIFCEKCIKRLFRVWVGWSSERVDETLQMEVPAMSPLPAQHRLSRNLSTLALPHFVSVCYLVLLLCPCFPYQIRLRLCFPEQSPDNRGFILSCLMTFIRNSSSHRFLCIIAHEWTFGRGQGKRP